MKRDIAIIALLALIVMPAQSIAPASARAKNKSSAQKLNVSKPVISESKILGSWNAHVFEVERHPTVIIKTCSQSHVSGLYVGPMGQFPLWGDYSIDTGKVTLNVDFSKSPLVRLRGLKSCTAILSGQLANDKIDGVATFPELAGKQFRWEAHKATPGGDS